MLSWEKLSNSSFIASISSLFFRGISVLSSFLVGWVVSRLLGVEFAGEALFFLTCITVAVVVSTLGYDSAISKLAAESKGMGLDKLKEILFRCCVRVVAPSFLCAVLFFSYQILITKAWAFGVWAHSALAIAATFSCILSLTLLNMFSFVFQGLGKISLTIFSQRTIFNLFLAFLLLIGFWFFKSMKVDWLLKFTYASIIFSAFASLLFILKILLFSTLKGGRSPLTNEENTAFSDFSRHAYRISLAQLLSIYSIQFIISFLSDMGNMSGYLISGRISSVLAFFILAVSNVLMPKIAQSFYNKDSSNLKLNYKKSIVFSSAFGLPIFFVMFYFSKEILYLFGDGFDKYHVVLEVLLIGQAINCLTGASDMVLTYMGGVREHKRNVYIGVMISLVVSFILIPQYGAVGAAIASLLSSSIVNVLDVYFIQRRLRFGRD